MVSTTVFPVIIHCSPTSTLIQWQKWHLFRSCPSFPRLGSSFQPQPYHCLLSSQHLSLPQIAIWLSGCLLSPLSTPLSHVCSVRAGAGCIWSPTICPESGRIGQVSSLSPEHTLHIFTLYLCSKYFPSLECIFPCPPNLSYPEMLDSCPTSSRKASLITSAHRDLFLLWLLQSYCLCYVFC